MRFARIRSLSPSRLSAFWQQAITIALVLGLALAIQLGRAYKEYRGDLTGLYRIGERFYQHDLAALLARKPYVHPHSIGLEGQFFFFLAHDPAIRHGVYRFLDHPRLRAQRIGYPAMAWLCVLGYRPLIPVSLWMLNMMALVAGVIMFGRRASQRGGTHFYGLAYGFSAPALVVIDHQTCELVMTFFLLLAFDAFERRRYLGLAAATLVAVFCKEVCLVWLLALIVHAILGRDKKILWGSAVVLAAWLGWQAWLAHQIPANYLADSTPRIFNWPLKGVAQQVVAMFREHRHLIQGYELGLMLALLSMSFRAFAMLRRSGWRNPLILTFAAWGGCAVLMNRFCWESSTNFARQLAMLVVLALWLMPTTRAARADTWGQALCSLWRIWDKLLKRLF